MTGEISNELREFVRKRANQCCEYCLLPEKVGLHKHEPDHIIPRQHGGLTNQDNLALACFRCNRYKGPNVGSIDPENGLLAAFFNPRMEKWADHFALEGAVIHPLSAIVRVTEKILRFNTPDRVHEREKLIQFGLYTA